VRDGATESDSVQTEAIAEEPKVQGVADGITEVLGVRWYD
jgi:hypothetical protein